MGSHKFHALRKLVSPAKHQQLQEDPSDELAMVGRSEVPVCLAADRPPAHLLKSLHGRDAAATTATTTSGHKRPPPLTPPRSPPRSAAGAATMNPASGSRNGGGGGSGSGSPVAAAPPDSPLSGYRRSPVPEPIMEVDELEDAHGPRRPVDAAAPPPPPPAAVAPSYRSRCSLESIAETPTPLVEAEGSDETLPSLTASSSAASSLAGRPSSDEVDIRGGVTLPPAETGGKEMQPAGQPVRVAGF